MIGQDHQVSILDFGIGCLLAETEEESLVDTMSTANSVASGLDCASPESIMDPTNLTPPGDQYSLGCVLYFCLAGHYPFPDGSAAEKMMAHQLKQPESLRNLCPEAPASLIDIVERLMQKAPEARYASTTEVVEALRPLVPTTPLPARPVVRPAPLREPAPSNGRPSPPPVAETPRPITPPIAPPRAVPVNGSLPNRQSLRGPAPAPQEVTPVVVEARALEHVIPGAVDDSSVGRSWEERFGPIGIAVGAIIACGLAWLIAAQMF
jgi:serine/threonine-protein kinase